MNHHLCRHLTALAAAATFGLAPIATAVPLDSSLFNHQYNGDVYPVPNYTENSPFIDPQPTSDGSDLIYHAPTGGGYWDSTDWSVTSATGLSVEASVKLTDDPTRTEGAAGTLAIYFGTGSAGDILSIGLNSVWVGNGAIQVDTNDNTDGYHTFRATLEEDGGGAGAPTINFYRDGQLIHTWANGGNFASNVLFFGSGGGSFGNEKVNLDYIRWDNTGAYEPVPEPGSAALIGLGSLLCLWHRRR